MEKDLGVLVTKKFDMSQQCALASQGAQHTLVYIKRIMVSRAREVIVPNLLSPCEAPSGVMPPGLWSSAQERYEVVVGECSSHRRS